MEFIVAHDHYTDNHYKFLVNWAKKRGMYFKVSLSKENIGRLLMGQPLIMHLDEEEMNSDTMKIFIDIGFSDGDIKVEAPDWVSSVDTYNA